MGVPRMEKYSFCRYHGTFVGPYPICAARTPRVESQHFWRCTHHPSAIRNFFTPGWTCVHGCHNVELKWFDNGTHRQLEFDFQPQVRP